MKTQIAIALFFWAAFLGCTAPKKSSPAAPIPTPATKVIEKPCEDVFKEEISARWRKVEGKTIYPGFIKDDSLINRFIGDLKPCLIGKDKLFIISSLGQPSLDIPGSINYHCYPVGETKLDSSRCLTFRFDTETKVSNVIFWTCRSAIDKE